MVGLKLTTSQSMTGQVKTWSYGARRQSPRLESGASAPNYRRESDGSMSTYQTDARVDHYINSLPDWQQEICRRVRDLVHAADPDVTETIKRTRQPYFTLEGNICALLGAKDHINVFIYDPIAPDPQGIINQGHGNQTARAIQIRQGETINEPALLSLFRAVIANNRVGGWRKLKESQ
jgi:hypothetical protein